MTVPGTDAYRTKLRYQMRSSQVRSGFPLAFFTLNPADVKHPFTLRFSVDGLDFQDVGFPCDDDALFDALRSENLARRVAEDPVAAVKAFDLHVRLFFEELLGCTIDPSDLAVDGIASKGDGGILGDLFAAFGAVEPQLRGSLHIHMLLHMCGFITPQDLLRRFHNRWAELREMLWRWVKSVSFTSVEALPRYLGCEARSFNVCSHCLTVTRKRHCCLTTWQITSETLSVLGCLTSLASHASNLVSAVLLQMLWKRQEFPGSSPTCRASIHATHLWPSLAERPSNHICTVLAHTSGMSRMFPGSSPMCVVTHDWIPSWVGHASCRGVGATTRLTWKSRTLRKHGLRNCCTTSGTL